MIKTKFFIEIFSCFITVYVAKNNSVVLPICFHLFQNHFSSF